MGSEGLSLTTTSGKPAAALRFPLLGVAERPPPGAESEPCARTRLSRPTLSQSIFCAMQRSLTGTGSSAFTRPSSSTRHSPELATMLDPDGAALALPQTMQEVFPTRRSARRHPGDSVCASGVGSMNGQGTDRDHRRRPRRGEPDRRVPRGGRRRADHRPLGRRSASLQPAATLERRPPGRDGAGGRTRPHGARSTTTSPSNCVSTPPSSRSTPSAHTVLLAGGEASSVPHARDRERRTAANARRTRCRPARGAHVSNARRRRRGEGAEAQDARKAVVVGGSFIGSEVAASLSMLGLDVTIVERGDRLVPALGVARALRAGRRALPRARRRAPARRGDRGIPARTA